MSDSMEHLRQVVVIAGPAGCGKDSIINEILKRSDKFTKLVTAVTRSPREGELEGFTYHYLSNERFLHELEVGNILEYYHRKETNTYYGTYKPDLETRISQGKIVIAQIQIVGAKYLKEHYNATTFFIMPPSLEAFEHRIRARSPMSDTEWQERLAFTKREIEEEAPWYDYRIANEDGKLSEAVDHVLEILKKEGYDV